MNDDTIEPLKAAAAARLRAARQARGLSQQRLATDAGMSITTLRRAECAHDDFTFDSAFRIGAALGIPPSELVADPDDG